MAFTPSTYVNFVSEDLAARSRLIPEYIEDVELRSYLVRTPLSCDPSDARTTALMNGTGPFGRVLKTHL